MHGTPTSSLTGERRSYKPGSHSSPLSRFRFPLKGVITCQLNREVGSCHLVGELGCVSRQVGQHPQIDKIDRAHRGMRVSRPGDHLAEVWSQARPTLAA